MPGRLLIFDPMLTHRMMMKSLLAQEFFDVSVAADATEFRASLRYGAPDLVLIAYQPERDCGFSNLHHLKSSAEKSHIPVAFLHHGDDPHIWDHSHDCLVDEVIAYGADRWLIAARLNLLIREKERTDAIFARQRTITEMGFAEEVNAFPPAPAKAVVLDFSCVPNLLDSQNHSRLVKLLSQDFPVVRIRTEPSNVQADILILDETAVGRDAVFTKICVARANKSTSHTQIVFVTPAQSMENAAKALELGASEFVLNQPNVAELACRLRRLIWQQHVALRAERTLSNHLKSALTDPLTGLYNRRYALQHLGQLIFASQNTHQTITAMVLDLDRFKYINDTYGHPIGDLVLQETSRRLKRSLRSADLIARIGGEEFLIVLKDTALPVVRVIAERLRREISDKVFNLGSTGGIAVSTSIGVSATQNKWRSTDALIESADQALYIAKGSGRNQVNFCPSSAA
jgi:two-component system cell cycle response regulator